MEHMTNACIYNHNLWKNHNQLFRVSDRNPNNMKTIMDNWRKKPYQNTILNRAWRLSLGFVLWAIWKERNNLIFKEERRTEEERWKQIIQNIRETILGEKWYEDWEINPQEERIMKGLNLKPSMLNASSWKHHTPMESLRIVINGLKKHLSNLISMEPRKATLGQQDLEAS